VTSDPYVDPATGTLRNRLGVADPATLAEFEVDITAAALFILRQKGLRGRYDLAHLQAFHRAIFGDIYQWAGEIRTVAMARTDLFALPQHIETYGAQVLSQLATEEHLRELPFDRFVPRLAHFLGEINAVHPFRDGNGRAQRAFSQQRSGRPSARGRRPARPMSWHHDRVADEGPHARSPRGS
jgi:cell filamentation protein